MVFRLSFVLFILRLVLGVVFIVHGQPKIAHPDAFVQFFASHGIGGGLTTISFVGAVELLGGILLILGLLTRPSAFLLVIDMLVALFVVELRDGFGVGAQLVTLLLATNIILLVLGSGSFGIDHWVRKHRYLLNRFF